VKLRAAALDRHMIERFGLAVMKVARNAFRNTWVHRLPITTWAYRSIVRLIYGDAENEVQFRGGRYVISTADVSVVPTLISQEFEAFELDLFEQFLRPGMRVMDIGANIGIYTVIAGKRVGSHGRVYAFEPVPENLAFLRRNVELNGLRNVETIPAAVGHQHGWTRMLLSPKDIGTHSVAVRGETDIDTISMSEERYLDVPLTRVDRFALDHSVQPDVIKMDIEGYEPFAIQGAVRTLRQQPILFIEFSPPHIEQYGSDPEVFLRSLVETYDSGYLIDERARRLVPIQRPERMRKLWNANLLFMPGRFTHQLQWSA
jgi:FkbM family methyltransferase